MRMSSQCCRALSRRFLLGHRAALQPGIIATAPSAAPLPSISVEAPKHVARPSRPERVATRGGVSPQTRRTVGRHHSRRRHAHGWIRPTIGQNCRAGEGCQQLQRWLQSSLLHGAPALLAVASPAGRVTWNWSLLDNVQRQPHLQTILRVDCVETKVFLGEYPNKARWNCSSLQVAGKFRVAELRRPKRLH